MVYLSGLKHIDELWRKASGNYVESFTSRLLQPDGKTMVESEQEDVIKWCAGGLYAGAADTVCSLHLLSYR